LPQEPQKYTGKVTPAKGEMYVPLCGGCLGRCVVPQEPQKLETLVTPFEGVCGGAHRTSCCLFAVFLSNTCTYQPNSDAGASFTDSITPAVRSLGSKFGISV
jgi:hypothetical protein